MIRHEELYNLETSLLEHSTRTSQDYLNRILSDNFLEFGSSGHIWTKDDVLQSLPHEKPQLFKISNFHAHDLAENLVLLTYSLNYNNRNTLRSSIWKNHEGTWKIQFHQGTKIGAEGRNL